MSAYNTKRSSTFSKVLYGIAVGVAVGIVISLVRILINNETIGANILPFVGVGGVLGAIAGFVVQRSANKR